VLEGDADGFEIETLLNVRALAAGMRVVEVPSFEGRRLYGLSNLSTWRDGYRVLRTITRERKCLRDERRGAPRRMGSTPALLAALTPPGSPPGAVAVRADVAAPAAVGVVSPGPLQMQAPDPRDGGPAPPEGPLPDVGTAVVAVAAEVVHRNGTAPSVTGQPE
jgi:hypothetical protein